jgi:uncharacterized membrane protein YfcA
VFSFSWAKSSLSSSIIAMSLWILFVTVFFAIFTQSVAGFGMTLVAMPILGLFYDLKLISPLIALVGIVAKILLLIKYGSAFEFKTVWKITLASLIFVPVGVWVLDYLDKDITLDILGVVIFAYAVFSLLNVSIPEFKHPVWAFIFGSLAGLLGGAFNASGPPVVLYASSREWSPIEFKSNLQGYALVNGAFIVVNHYVYGNINSGVMNAFLISIPAVLLGVWAGVSLDKYLNPELFRKVVMWLMIGLGISLIVK